MNKNPLMKAALLAVVLFAAAGILFVSRIFSPGTGENDRADRYGDGDPPVAAAEKEKTGTEAPLPGDRYIPTEPRHAAALMTTDDIKREYGRVETVHLFGGRTYTGAVIATDERNYTIVTVGGQVQVPMKDVKTRIIIR
ncbi:MAG: hypothetical protein EPN93_08700 [Spirochaetes bacterium]|nr:MAG: hypothetical protein EPN93_08700 [Spirochaetota bacterium]